MAFSILAEVHCYVNLFLWPIGCLKTESCSGFEQHQLKLSNVPGWSVRKLILRLTEEFSLTTYQPEKSSKKTFLAVLSVSLRASLEFLFYFVKRKRGQYSKTRENCPNLMIVGRFRGSSWRAGRALPPASRVGAAPVPMQSVHSLRHAPGTCLRARCCSDTNPAVLAGRRAPKSRRWYNSISILPKEQRSV